MSIENLASGLDASMTVLEALEVATGLALQGIAVFPIAIKSYGDKPGLSKRPLTNHGHLDATTEVGSLGELFASAESRVKSGEVMGVGWLPASINAVVFDGDRHYEGQDGVKFIENELHLPPHTGMYDTATGGRHIVLRKRDDQHISNASPWFSNGVDIRSDNGWAVAPGTRTPWGSWAMVEGKPALNQLALVPESIWLQLTETTSRDVSDLAVVAAESIEGLRMSTQLSEWVADLGPKWELPDASDPFGRSMKDDRSAHFHRIIAMCKREGITQGQAVSLVTSWCEGVDKYVGRIPQEVARTWAKVGKEPITPTTVLPGLNQAEPGTFLGPDGLLVATLAASIVAARPIGVDPGGAFWTYREGVWRQDTQVVSLEVARRLGERFRPAHVNATRDFIKAVHARQLSQNPTPDHVNLPNGMLEWRTGKLLDHSPEFLSTVQLSVDWDPDATCPNVDEWLASVLPADLLEGAHGGFIWEVIGYLCISGNPFHKALLLLGTGRNGKGTFLRLIARLLGNENISAVTLHDLTNNRFRAADLLGKLANIAGDLDATAINSTGVFKAMTGGDLVPAERKYGDAFSFTPWAVPVFSANAVWRSADTSDGYLARWVTVPFPHSFEGREARAIGDRLQTDAELRGVLVKGITAVRVAMERGNFSSPESVAAEHKRFGEQSDPIRAFIEGVSIPSPGTFISRTDLWSVYIQGWVADEGIRAPLSRNGFYAAIRSAGWREGKHTSVGFLDRQLTVEVTDDFLAGPGRYTLRPAARTT